MDGLGNNSARTMFLFYYRILIFMDFIIRQLSMAQFDLAATVKAIDVASTEKRNLHLLLDTIEEINHRIEEILRIKKAFLEGFAEPFHRMVLENSAELIAGLSPSEWGVSIGSFSLFPDGLDGLAESGGSLAFAKLLFLGFEAPAIDLDALRILQTMIALGFAADSIAALGKSFTVLLPVSTDSSTASDGLIRNIRGLSQEIEDQLQQMSECLERIQVRITRLPPCRD